MWLSYWYNILQYSLCHLSLKDFVVSDAWTASWLVYITLNCCLSFIIIFSIASLSFFFVASKFCTFIITRFITFILMFFFFLFCFVFRYYTIILSFILANSIILQWVNDFEALEISKLATPPIDSCFVFNVEVFYLILSICPVNSMIFWENLKYMPRRKLKSNWHVPAV